MSSGSHASDQDLSARAGDRTVRIRLSRLCVLWLCVAVPGCGADIPEGVAPDEPALQKLLAHYDGQYDPANRMLRQEFSSPGYHTRFETGDSVHTTRESLIYALALLKRDQIGDSARAEEILSQVVALQDSDPDSATFGVWPWLLEEPLEEMNSPDFNWADFCGASLAHILIQHASQLSEETRKATRDALRNATVAIRTRNVGPGYTNIAVLGGGVCAAAGELSGDAVLLEYGRNRLQGVVEQTEKHGGFNEYNSPPYCKVVIAECERILELVRDPATRAAAESIRTAAWKMIAGSLHLPTQQLAGPHSRSSRNRLRVAMVEFLNRRTGLDLKPHPSMLGGMPRGYGVVRPLMCPQDVLADIRRKRPYPFQIERVFVNSRRQEYRRAGITWFDDESCLGTVNRSSFWTQRKPLLAYWKTQDDPAVVLRLRFLHDGRDFASMGVRSVQQGPRVLSMLYPIDDAGSWHPSLDRPADGVFRVNDLRVRLELLGRGVTCSNPGDGRFALSAGDRRAVIHTLTSTFNGRPVEWQVGGGDEHVYLDGLCHTGSEVSLGQFSIDLVFGLELLKKSEGAAAAKPARDSANSGRISWQWGPGRSDFLVLNREALNRQHSEVGHRESRDSR